MTVEDEIQKTRLKYHSKKGDVQKPEVKHISVSQSGGGFKEYITIFLNIMKRDIMVRLGINKENTAKKIQMKQEYEDFMETFFK